MKNSSLQQAARHCLMIFLVFGVSIGAVLTSPQVAKADPDVPGAGPSIFVPVAQKEACTTLKSAGIGGFQVYGGASFGSPYYKDLMESGASWVRLTFDWSLVEPENTTPASYQWAHTDNIVKLAAEQCWPIVLLMEHNPGWASTMSQGPLDKVPVAELAQFMGALAERYDGDGISDAPGSPQVGYFEMYNEPDAGASGAVERWGMHGDEYAEMLKVVYPAIKKANPQAQIVFGGIAYDSFTDSPDRGVFVRSFFEDVLKNGGGPYFDIMNFHFYPLFGWNWTKQFPKDGPGLIEKVDAIRGLMQQYSIDKPIIITELSWHSNKDTAIYGSNTLQIRMVQQLYTQAMAAAIPMVAWWPLADVGGSYQLDSGLVTNSEQGPVTRKPAYVAYQVLVRELGGARFVAEVRSDVDVKVYQFVDDIRNRTIYVAWTNPTSIETLWSTPTTPYQDTTRTTTVTLNGGSATVYDAAWEQVATVADGDDGKRDGKLKVTIDGDPKYVVIGG
jgi:hypothetical protein